MRRISTCALLPPNGLYASRVMSAFGPKNALSSVTKRALSSAGYQLRRTVPGDLDDRTRTIIEHVKPYTLTSPERLNATCDAVRYVTRGDIPGAIVECGVWAGGSMMAAALTLHEMGDLSRDLYLFDTFEGMTVPTKEDVDSSGALAAHQLTTASRVADSIWCYASLDQVKQNFARVAYPHARLHFVKGPVEATLPSSAPEVIAVLRLDTDWYESTRHELKHLVPRMSPGAVLLIDDYGHWQGARKAVDEWIEGFDRPVLLSRVDYTGRMAVIPASASSL